MSVDASHDILEIFIWIDGIQLAGADETVEDLSGLSSFAVECIKHALLISAVEDLGCPRWRISNRGNFRIGQR